ncbi:hypothetical protein [Amycolatopsis anabasis]|uniref:hypothetical protein n=1 Tax=Amycolatopsis anabasis TaxID=1840409 RepID=UPI00131ECEC2|nr:hypothetical protein [Amycolatopsis anabasis]
MTGRPVPVVLAAAAFALAACGDAATPPNQPEQRGTTSSTPPPAPERTVRGVVRPGVEAGCLVLPADGTEYLLIGRAEALPPGRDVVVRGRVDRGTATTCQQGTPLVVLEARPA